ncbi:polymerase-associated protein [Adelaide River virus]|uniref:Polymerase-associated protein n=1 Tax=Adelaide River virus TaxID=31612 RepID=K4HH65_ARV|nr:polymerase-associated protein [Adelaide River virus]AFR23534.1 polymerase-associated protein [Adelaide River virus]
MEKFNPSKVLGEYDTDKLIASINETNWNLDDDPEFSAPQESIEPSNSIDNYRDEIVKIGVCLSSNNQDYSFLDNQKEKEIFLEEENDWEVEFTKKLEDHNVPNESELEVQINIEDLIALLHFLNVEIDQYNILPLSLQNKVILQRKKEGKSDDKKRQNGKGDKKSCPDSKNQSNNCQTMNAETNGSTNLGADRGPNQTEDNSSMLENDSEAILDSDGGELFQFIIKTMDQGIRVKKKFSGKKVKITRENIGLDYHVINGHIHGKSAKDSIDLKKLMRELIKKGRKYKDYSNQLDLSEIEF